MRVDQCFNIKKGDIITFTGGGGKTSLIFALAKEISKNLKVLITTTTKIYIPEESQYEEFILSETEMTEGVTLKKEEIKKGSAQNIFILGARIDRETGKIIGISEEILVEYKEKYDCILIEGDGSNGKPLKFWNDYDPIISRFSTKIIAVTNLDALDKKILEVAHRPSELCKKHGWCHDEIIDITSIGTYIMKGDFFKNSKNNMERIFFVNGVEGLNKLNSALELGNILRKNGINDQIIIGSFRENEFYPYRKIVAILLASGFSRRFGGDKLLYKYENKTLLEKSLENIDEINFFRKQVVIREDKKEIFCINELVKNPLWKVVINNQAHLGQSQGIKVAVNILGSEENMMFFTGDQPLMNKEVILTIIKSYFNEDMVTIPYVGEDTLSPIIFPNIYKEKLENIDGDKGGKSILRNSDKINKVYFPDKIPFFDIDTQDDVEIVKKLKINSKK